VGQVSNLRPICNRPARSTRPLSSEHLPMPVNHAPPEVGTRHAESLFGINYASRSLTVAAQKAYRSRDRKGAVGADCTGYFLTAPESVRHVEEPSLS